MLTWSPLVLSPGPSGSQPIWKPVGAPLGYQSAMNSLAFASVPLTNTAECPGARLVTPSIASDEAKEAWLSFIRQPVRSTLVVPTLVSSNQSAATGLLPLLHGATSVIAICAAEVPPAPAGVTVSL